MTQSHNNPPTVDPAEHFRLTEAHNGLLKLVHEIGYVLNELVDECETNDYFAHEHDSEVVALAEAEKVQALITQLAKPDPTDHDHFDIERVIACLKACEGHATKDLIAGTCTVRPVN